MLKFLGNSPPLYGGNLFFFLGFAPQPVIFLLWHYFLGFFWFQNYKRKGIVGGQNFKFLRSPPFQPPVLNLMLAQKRAYRLNFFFNFKKPILVGIIKKINTHKKAILNGKKKKKLFLVLYYLVLKNFYFFWGNYIFSQLFILHKFILPFFFGPN